MLSSARGIWTQKQKSTFKLSRILILDCTPGARYRWQWFKSSGDGALLSNPDGAGQKVQDISICQLDFLHYIIELCLLLCISCPSPFSKALLFLLLITDFC